MSHQILSVTPARTNPILSGDKFNAFEITFHDVNAAIQTIIFDTKHVFTFEDEEDECALGGSSLITCKVDRLRAVAGL
jgi:hypothetical protein